VLPKLWRLIGCCVLWGGLLAMAGCAPQLDRIELAVQQNGDEIARLRAENLRLQQDVAAVTALLRLESETGDETSAQRLAKLSQLSQRIEQLMRKLDDNTEYMRELSARVDLIATRAGVPTVGEYKPPGGGAPPDLEALPEAGRTIFETAELDRSRGNIALARDGFQEFLETYPTSELADDATYWLGDLAYGENNYSEALEYFRKLLDDFPEAERAPAALLKGVYCLEALERLEDADAMIDTLVARFPDSNEAALARERRD